MSVVSLVSTAKYSKNGFTFDSQEIKTKGKRSATIGVVSIISLRSAMSKRFVDRGLDNAGKTTVVKKFNGEDTHTISPTLGFNIYDLEHKGYKLNVWDVGGQKSLRSYWRNYYESTDGLIWVVDSADISRLDDCRKELHSLILEERLAGASLLVFANKQDLEGSLSCDEIASNLQLSKITTSHWEIVPCSAHSGENLIKGMDWLLDDISQRIFTID